MANIDHSQLKRNILNDMRVELADEFDRNFERKAFFTRKWKKAIKKMLSVLLLSCHCRIFASYWSTLYDFKSSKRI